MLDLQKEHEQILSRSRYPQSLRYYQPLAVMAVEMGAVVVIFQVEPPHMEVMAVRRAEAEAVVGFLQVPTQKHQVALAEEAKLESIVGR